MLLGRLIPSVAPIFVWSDSLGRTAFLSFTVTVHRVCVSRGRPASQMVNTVGGSALTWFPWMRKTAANKNFTKLERFKLRTI